MSGRRREESINGDGYFGRGSGEDEQAILRFVLFRCASHICCHSSTLLLRLCWRPGTTPRWRPTWARQPPPPVPAWLSSSPPPPPQSLEAWFGHDQGGATPLLNTSATPWLINQRNCSLDFPCFFPCKLLQLIN